MLIIVCVLQCTILKSNQNYKVNALLRDKKEEGNSRRSSNQILLKKERMVILVF